MFHESSLAPVPAPSQNVKARPCEQEEARLPVGSARRDFSIGICHDDVHTVMAIY